MYIYIYIYVYMKYIYVYILDLCICYNIARFFSISITKCHYIVLVTIDKYIPYYVQIKNLHILQFVYEKFIYFIIK